MKVSHLVLVWGIALPIPSFAAVAGFSTDDLAAAAEAAPLDAQIATARQLAAATATIRAAFVLNPATADTLLSRDERMVLERALGMDDGDQAVRIAWLMRASAVRVGLSPSADVTALYNPVADAFLLLRWARASGEWRIVAAALTPSARLLPQADAADWTVQQGEFLTALARTHNRALNQFALLTKTYSATDLFLALLPHRATDQAQVYGRIDTWLGTLIGWRGDAAQLSAWQALHKSIVEGRESGFLVADRAQVLNVTGLPVAIRGSLTPVAAIAHDAGSSLLLVSPLFPELLIAADFAAPGVMDLQALALVNLARSEAVEGVAAR